MIAVLRSASAPSENADGTGLTQVTDHSFTDFHPVWSDGKQLAFTSDCAGDQEIYVMNVDGTAVTQLTNNAGVDDRDPSWSPDDKQLVFVSFRDGDPEIFVMNADGIGVTQLTSEVFSDFLPVWTRR